MLRELRSSAMRVTSFTGFVETSSRLRTALFDAIDRSRKNDQVRYPLVLNRRDNGDVRGVRAQSFGTLRGNGERQLVFLPQRSVSESSNERRSIQILDDRDAERIHGVTFPIGTVPV